MGMGVIGRKYMGRRFGRSATVPVDLGAEDPVGVVEHMLGFLIALKRGARLRSSHISPQLPHPLGIQFREMTLLRNALHNGCTTRTLIL